jgi:hypothetical protein
MAHESVLVWVTGWISLRNPRLISFVGNFFRLEPFDSALFKRMVTEPIPILGNPEAMDRVLGMGTG